MRRTLIPLIALLFALASPLQAQILKVHFKDEKAAKKFKKHTTEIGGETVLIGEPVPGGGVLLQFKSGQLTGVTHKSGDNNDFFILDSKDPSKVPYRMENGKPVATKKRSVVTVHGKYISRMSVMMRSETIETIGREYRLRNGRVEELRAERDSFEKGSADWFATHIRMLAGYERLISWLRNLSFEDLAGKLAKEYAKEKKKVSEEASQIRADRALASVKLLGTSEELAAATQRAGGARYEFKVAESQHIRFTYLTERFSDDRALELLEFGEKVIEAFRVQFVDPYVSESFEDRIPEGPFQEFFFGPDDKAFHEKMLKEYYGLSWGTGEQARLMRESTGVNLTRPTAPRCLNYRRLPENIDPEGVFAHMLGHSLADYHFNDGPGGMSQQWMEEGLGYYLSFEFLGRNSVTCREFREVHYVGEKRKEGLKEVMMGYRDILTGVALEHTERIDRVMLKNLYDMENADLAKSWSFLEYIARTNDLKGQQWMRAACQFARNKGTFIAELRKVSEELFSVTGKDVFRVLDDRWRAYAVAESEKEW